MEFGYNFADPFFLDGDQYVHYYVNDFQNSVLRFGIDDLHQMNVVMDEMRTADGHLPMCLALGRGDAQITARSKWVCARNAHFWSFPINCQISL